MAKGMSVVDITVPLEEIIEISDRGGSIQADDADELAETGDYRTNVVAATLVVAALAFLLIPAGVRRSRS